MLQNWLRVSILIAITMPSLLPALDEASAGQAGTPTGRQPVTATLVVPSRLGDGGFNDQAKRGLDQAVAETGVEANVIENDGPENRVASLTAAAERSDLTIALGFFLAETATEVAARFPDDAFAVIDAEAAGDNVTSIVFREQEGAFLGGVAAGLMTETGTVGVVGGIPIPPVVRYATGFEAGVKMVNPGAEVVVTYAETFGDRELGKELTRDLFAAGADIVFPVAGLTGLGSLDAAKEKGAAAWIIGADTDQSQMLPDNQLCYVAKGIDAAVADVVRRAVDGTLTGGTRSLGLAEAGTELVDPGDRLPAAVRAEVGRYRQAIVDGDLVPPGTEAELAAFRPAALATPAAGAPAASARTYTVTDLGTLGGDYVEGNGLNAAGVMVGGSTTVVGQEPYGPGHRAFLWKDGEMADLGTLGGDFSHAIDLNDAEQVVGFSELPNGERHAFLWEDGAMTDLGTLGGSYSEAIRINNAGQVVGYSTTAPGQEAGDPGTHAFLWEEGEMTDLGTLDGEFSRANGINDAGQIVGVAETAAGETHAVRWDDGTATDLGTLPGYTVSRAVRIGPTGHIVGFATAPVGTPPAGGEEPRRAVLWADGETIDLGSLGGVASAAFGVDAAGRAVGGSLLADDPTAAPTPTPAAGEEVFPVEHAFIWEDGVLTDLNDLVPPDTAAVLARASAINDAGQIGVNAVVDGELHAVLLTPAD